MLIPPLAPFPSAGIKVSLWLSIETSETPELALGPKGLMTGPDLHESVRSGPFVVPLSEGQRRA